MKKKRWWCAAVSGALMLLCGCQADIHYQAEAVERARKFLLQEAVRELDLEQESFVRYSDPVLLHSPVIGGAGISVDGNLKSELRQICVAWHIPGKDQLYMVFGVSTPRMSDWYPNRVLKKKLRKRLPGVEILLPQAINFARLNLMDRLSVAEMNHIRYTYPALVQSAFPVLEKPEAVPPVPVVKSAKDKEPPERAQYALLWQLGERTIAFIGWDKNDDLSSWKCDAAGFYTREECAKYIRQTLTTPEEAFDFELPAAEKKAEDDSEEEVSADTGSKVGEEEGKVDGEEGNSGKKSKTDAAPAEEKR